MVRHLHISHLLNPYITSWSLRCSDQDLLAVPHARLKTNGHCAFERWLWHCGMLLDFHNFFEKQMATRLMVSSVCNLVFSCFYCFFLQFFFV